MSLFCKHEWDKLSEVTLPSAWEQMNAASRVSKTGELMMMVFEKHHTLTLGCKKCGDLRVIRTSSLHGA